MISLIHPSRGRPEKAKATFDLWMGNASGKNDIEYIMSVDLSDPKIKEYQRLSNQMPGTKWAISDNRNLVEAANAGAIHCKGNLLILISDDFECPKNWDEIILKAVKNKSDFVLKTADGLQPELVTLPIMDRVYYERQGYIFYPGYQHMFADDDLTVKAKSEGKLIARKDIVFKHRHHVTGATEKDDINLKAELTWDQGKELYSKRLQNNFN